MKMIIAVLVTLIASGIYHAHNAKHDNGFYPPYRSGYSYSSFYHHAYSHRTYSPYHAYHRSYPSN